MLGEGSSGGGPGRCHGRFIALGFGADFGAVALRGQGGLRIPGGAGAEKAAARAEPVCWSPTLCQLLVVPPVFALPGCVRVLYCRALPVSWWRRTGCRGWDATIEQASVVFGEGACAKVHSRQAGLPGVSPRAGCAGPAGGVAEAANYLVRSSPPGWGPGCVGLALPWLMIALFE